MFSDPEPSCTFWWEPTRLNVWKLLLDVQLRGPEACSELPGPLLDHGSTVDAPVLGFLTPAQVSSCCSWGLICEHLSHTTITLELLSVGVCWSCL